MIVFDEPKGTFKNIFLKYNQSPQGIYLFEGFSANVGVLPYNVEINEQMVATGILTSDSDLFDEKSLDSLTGVAVTKEHPDNFDAEITDMGGIVLTAFPSYLSHQDYSIPPHENIGGLRIKLAIWSEEILDYIAAGNSELSAGYTCDVIPSEGTWYGSPFSYIKTNIVYNHIAVVEKGSARNGTSSRLLSDNSERKFSILSNKTTKFTDSSITIIEPKSTSLADTTNFKADTADSKVDTKNSKVDSKANTKTSKVDATDSKVDTADIKNTPGTIENIDSCGNTFDPKPPMKQYALPSGKIVQLADDIYQQISDDFDTLIAEKQTLEKATVSAKKEVETITTTVTDARAKETELTKKLEEGSRTFSKSVGIAAKAERLGVKINYENFDPSAIMREAIAGKYPDTDKVTEETLFYLFNLIKVEDPEPATTDDLTKSSDSTKPNTVTDSQSGGLKSHIKNEKPEKDISSEDLGLAMQQLRRNRTKK